MSKSIKITKKITKPLLDETSKQSQEENKDFYSLLTSKIFNIEYDKVLEDKRIIVKSTIY